VRRAAVAIALAAGLASTPAEARGPKEKANAIELTVFGGYSFMLPVRLDRRDEVSRFLGGGTIAGGILYRPPYFVSPFVDVGYYPLYASRNAVDLGPDAGGRAVTTSSLAAIGMSAGLAADVWRLRIKAGAALYDLLVRSSVLGQEVRSSEIDGGYMFAIAGDVVRTARLHLGLEARVGFIVEADTTFLALGTTLGGKAIAW
jgi:hypothetical protein